jgi:hypothetical protein
MAFHSASHGAAAGIWQAGAARTPVHAGCKQAATEHTLSVSCPPLLSLLAIGEAFPRCGRVCDGDEKVDVSGRRGSQAVRRCASLISQAETGRRSCDPGSTLESRSHLVQSCSVFASSKLGVARYRYRLTLSRFVLRGVIDCHGWRRGKKRI